MGVEHGRLKDEDIKRFNRWMDEKGISSICSSCGESARTIARHSVTPSQIRCGRQVRGVIYPMIMLICNNCGHIDFFSAVSTSLYGNDLEQDDNN